MACEYWRGRYAADSCVANNFDWKLKEYGSEKAHQEMARWFENWQKKIDNDVALKTLDGTFPLPDDLKGQIVRSQEQPHF